ncbi:MAG: carbamoyl phosphate synthase small subunit, partial [Planctomycetota bacterium]
NHGFAVKEESLPDSLVITHRNLNDNTIAGVKLADPALSAFAVQYHPEAAAGPHDSHYLFNAFQETVDAYRAAR